MSYSGTDYGVSLSFFFVCVCWSYTLQFSLRHQGRCSSHQCQDTCSICSLCGKHLPHWGLNAHLGSQVWPQHQYFTFSNFFANSISFQQNLEALPPLPSSSARICSKLTVPLILSLRFLTEIDKEDVTQILEGWWDTGSPLTSAADGGNKMVIQRCRPDSPESQGAHTGEWEDWEGGGCPEGVCIIEDISHRSWQEFPPLPIAWEHFPSAHPSPSPGTVTLMKAAPRICIQITFSGSVRRYIHPCFDLHNGLLEKRHPPVIPWIFLDFRVWEEHGLHTPRNCWESPPGEHPNSGKSYGGSPHSVLWGIICQCSKVPTQPLPLNECQK